MASQAQILANQANARQSTGPKTEAGKSRSSLNSFRHGLTANIVVLPSEDIAVYQEFARNMLAELEPVGVLEQQLAQTIIDSQWRLNRVAALESNLLSLALLEPAPGHIDAIEDPNTRAALLEANALIVHERQLRNLHIQEQRLRRVINRSLEELASHHAAREFAERPKAVNSLPTIGFDFPSPKSGLGSASYILETISKNPAEPPISEHAESTR